MIPKKLKIKNFTSYKEIEIDFTVLTPIFSVTGNNGTGKSSIIDAITTALFNRARGTDERGARIDQLINNQEEEFEIIFDFEMNVNNYSIIRQKNRNGNHSLKFLINNTDVSEGIEVTQNKIYDVIKLDYETFLDTVCIWQGKSGNFMDKKPNERKEVFIKILNLDKYEELESHTKKLKEKVSIDLGITQENIKNLLNVIDQKEALENKLSESLEKQNIFNSEIKEKEVEYDKLLKEQTEYEQNKKEYDNQLKKIQQLKTKLIVVKESESTKQLQIKNIKNELQDFSIESLNQKEIKIQQNIINIEKQIEDIENCKTILNQIEEIELNVVQVDKFINEFKNKNSLINGEVNSLVSQIKILKEKYMQLKEYNSGVCNFCGNEITLDHKNTHLNELLNAAKELSEQKKSKMEEIEKNNIIIAEKNEEKISLEKQKNQLKNDSVTKDNEKRQLKNEKKNKESEILNIQKEKMQKEKLLENIKSHEERITEIKLEIVELNQEIDNCNKNMVDPIEEKQFSTHIIKQEINSLRSSVSDLQSTIAVCQDKLDTIAKNEQEVINLKEKEIINKTLYEDYVDLAAAFGKSGIQSIIIENSLPEIEKEVNDVLNVLCNGKVSVEFRTQKEYKDKKVVRKSTSMETLDIIVKDSNGVRTYETYSGGEKYRIDFACHVGMSKFLANRSNSKIDFFIIDEGLGSQDETARGQFAIAVNQLTKIFKQIMIITHIDELKDVFAHQLCVEKNNREESKIKIIK